MKCEKAFNTLRHKLAPISTPEFFRGRPRHTLASFWAQLARVGQQCAAFAEVRLLIAVVLRVAEVDEVEVERGEARKRAWFA